MEAEARKLAGPAFALVREGAVHVGDVSGRLLRLERGDLLTVAAGGECSVAPAGPRSRADVLELGSEFAARAAALAGCGLECPAAPLRVDRRGSDAARRATRILIELERAAPASRRRALERVALRLELLALALEERPSALESGAARRPERWLGDAVDELFAGALEHASLGALAERVGLSERQVSRLFRAQYGRTFREHRSEIRLERARALLADSGHSVLRIAGETGWSSLAHFNAAFRRGVGLTPTEYRRWARREARPA